MNILIIEDEQLTAQDLAKSIQSVHTDDVQFDFVESVAAGLAYFLEGHEIDLIFSDIQLGDGISFDIFSKVQVDVPIIFCTAYDEYALEAFKNNGIEYILKPFSDDSVAAALKKWQKLKGQNQNEAMHNVLAQLLNKREQTNKTLLLTRGSKVYPTPLRDIALFYIEDKYVFAYHKNTSKFILNTTLDELTDQYPNQFFRVNRQQLINRVMIQEVSSGFARKLNVKLSIPYPKDITVGKMKVKAFMKWLGR